MKRKSNDGGVWLLPRYQSRLLALLMLAVPMLLAACGSETVGGSGEVVKPEEKEETSGEAALTPPEATVGPNESGAMPAEGREKDPSHPPPKNPPEGVKTFPATTNRNVEGQVTYEEDPPTHGDHAPSWQKCGFYSSPVQNERAVHSMDHGTVWITYRSELPTEQVDILRGLAREEYVLVSPYPGLFAPVVATAWRNQLTLERADDPRLRQFVDQFRLSETAPRSGNGCENGVGEPET